MFECSVYGDFVRVRTPYLYPEGDLIDLFLKSALHGVTTVSDLGETVRWLNSNTLSAKRSPKQAGLISDISQTHGVEFFRGMLKARSNEPAELADAVTRVSQAAVRVSDLIFTSRLRSVESVSDEVADFLQELHLPFERNKRLIGRSGKNWKIDFQVSTPERSSLISVLSSGSRSAAQPITKGVVASWYDLSQYKASPEPLSFISLIDDSADVWSDEDFNLVGDSVLQERRRNTAQRHGVLQRIDRQNLLFQQGVQVELGQHAKLQVRLVAIRHKSHRFERRQQKQVC
jgi:hypothetical protein